MTLHSLAATVFRLQRGGEIVMFEQLLAPVIQRTGVQTSMASQLTDRQREIKQRLDRGMGAREIAEDLGITRNAVYQQIQRLRRHGVLEHDYTPTGLPAREQRAPGVDVLERLFADGSADEDQQVAASGIAALVQVLAETRNELDRLSRRLSEIVPR